MSLYSLTPWLEALEGFEHRVGHFWPLRIEVAARVLPGHAPSAVRSPLQERAKPVPTGMVGAKGFFIKRLQRIQGMARCASPCDKR